MPRMRGGMVGLEQIGHADTPRAFTVSVITVTNENAVSRFSAYAIQKAP